MRFSKYIMLVLIVPLLASCAFLNAYPKIESSYRGVTTSRSNAYTDSPPITINGDSDFANQAITESWKGNGTESDPYVISGLNITSGSESINLLSISNTAAYFRFEYSLLVGGLRGIRFENVTHSSVVNNTIHGSFDQGIAVFLSKEITISNNTIHSISINGHGVYWLNVSNGVIANNSIFNCGDRGLLLDYCSDCNIVSNAIHSMSGDGIGMRDCEFNRIHRNMISNNTRNGIIFGASVTSNITKNEINRNGQSGISLEESQMCIIEDNLIDRNGKEGLLIVGHDFEVRNNTFYENALWNMRVIGVVTGIQARWNNFIENRNEPVGDSNPDSTYDSNYWSEWTTPDNNHDGIVDIPFDYTNGDELFDAHPRVKPYLDFRLHILTKVVIVSPNGGSFVDQTELNITWGEAGDTFGHDVTYSVFSSMNGVDWNELASGLNPTTFLWNMSDVPHSDNYLIRVQASCSGGLISNAVTLETFTITTSPSDTSSENNSENGMNIGLIVGVLLVVVIAAVFYLKRR